MKMILSALFLVIAALFQGISCEKVKCDHTTPVCECKVTTDEECEFQMDIEMLQTFTRYVVNADGDSRGTAGRVWYIDSNGVWQPTPASLTAPCANIPIGNNSCSDPYGVDGETFRSFIAVNGRIPGPTLIVTQYQLLKVNVINRLASESISIHWHGQHQRNSNWMDGVDHVTQCGIPPGASFTYIFNATQYGTHWYHSHSGAQRTDGLYGSLIVKEKANDYSKIVTAIADATGIAMFEDLPAEHTLNFLDWQKSNSLDLFTQIHSSIRYFHIDQASGLPNPQEPPRTYSSDGAEVGPVPYWSGLINGRGCYSARNNQRSNCLFSTFEVSPGNIYRFRLIGAQSLFAYRVSIDDHKLIVIATDGEYIKPIEVDYIIIHSGERYDFLLKTKNLTELNNKYNYAIRGITLETKSRQDNVLLGSNAAEAVLRYTNQNNDLVPMNYDEIFRGYTDQDGTIIGDPDTSSRCTIDTCIALNCPFEKFPPSYNTNCTHVHELESLFPFSDETLLPDVSESSIDRLFFNFGFEGVSQTSAINARNFKLPSGALAVLSNDDVNDIRDKEFCKGLTTTTTCDDNGNAVISPECYCTHVQNIEKDRSVQLVLSAVGPSPNDTENFLFAHPIHLHGHYFHVVDIQFGEYNDGGNLTAGNSDINCGGTQLCTNPSWIEDKNYAGESGKVNKNAPRKDTLLIPAGGYAVVYFKTYNPGWWFLHCHIEVHQLEGMGAIIDVGENKRFPSHMYKCGNFSLTVEQYRAALSGSKIKLETAAIVFGVLIIFFFATIF